VTIGPYRFDTQPFCLRWIRITTSPCEEGSRFLRGDCNEDGTVDISDAVCILGWLFLGGSTPGCLAAANANGDDAVNISDPLWILQHLFSGGPPPPAPFPRCGPDPTADGLECAQPAGC
jgi:hypothetical protein